MDNNVEVKDYGRHKLINLHGEIALETIDNFRDTLYSLIDEHNESIIVNMKHLTFIDSSVIGALVFAQKKMNKLKLNFALMNVSEDLGKILKTASLYRIFTVYKNEDEVEQ